MAKNSLNSSGNAFAKSKIGSGNVDKTSSWFFSSEDGNKLLGPGGDDWTNYGRHHLGVDNSAGRNTKAHWKYPFAKNGTVYRSGIIAVKQRAGGQGDTEILNAADNLLQMIDKNKNDLRNQTTLPPYDPDGDGDNDAENAMMAIDASKVLMDYARCCLNGDTTVDQETTAKAERLLFGKKEKESNIIAFSKPKSKSILRLNAKSNNSDVVQMDMFGVVGGSFWSDGGITKESFAKMLKDIPKNTSRVDLRLSSPGGDVFEGRAIANMMQDSKFAFDINIIAEACSIASIIAMAGDTVHMSEGSVMLVHRCYTMAMGNSQEMKKLAADLERIDQEMVATYQRKTKMSEEDIINLMDENRYMNSKEAKKLGFVDSIAHDSVTNNASSLLKIAALDIDRKVLHLPPLPKDSRSNYKAALAALKKFD